MMASETCDHCDRSLTGPPFGPRGAQWCDLCWWEYLGTGDTEAFRRAAEAAKVEIDGEAPKSRTDLEAKLKEARGRLEEAEREVKSLEDQLWEAEEERDEIAREVLEAEVFLAKLDTPRPAVRVKESRKLELVP